MYVHRVKMEARLGRRLTWSEIVHHDNENKADNSDDNLKLMIRVDHARHHMLKNPISKPCAVCGTVFTPHQTKRKRDRSCSRTCRATLISEMRSGIQITAALAHDIRTLDAGGVSHREIERRLKVGRITVRRLLAGNLTVRPPPMGEAVGRAIAEQRKAANGT